MFSPLVSGSSRGIRPLVSLGEVCLPLCSVLLFCCFYVGQSALLFVLVLASSSCLHLRVDLALADGVYHLVPEQEQQQPAPSQFELEQDPSQVRKSPRLLKASTGAWSPI